MNFCVKVFVIHTNSIHLHLCVLNLLRKVMEIFCKYKIYLVLLNNHLRIQVLLMMSCIILLKMP